MRGVARLACAPREGFVARFAWIFDLTEARAREILAQVDSVPGGGWVDTPLFGLRLYHFQGGPRVATADCGLVHLAAGTPFPSHRHLGREWNLVLAVVLEAGIEILTGGAGPEPAR